MNGEAKDLIVAMGDEDNGIELHWKPADPPKGDTIKFTYKCEIRLEREASTELIDALLKDAKPKIRMALRGVLNKHLPNVAIDYLND